MKHFYRHPQFKRWGMYSVLLAALGFSVSMNPDHFNNIARYETDTFSADFAATSPEKIEAFASKEVTNFLGSNGKMYTAQVIDYGDKRRVRFVMDQSQTEAQGAECNVCGRTFDVVSNLDDKEALVKELKATFAQADHVTDLAAVEVKADEDIVQDTSRQYLEEWAKPCLSIKDKQDKMDCHAGRLIALSTKLEDDASKGSAVLKYFQKYLKASLRSAFSSNFYRVRSMSNRIGSIERDEKAEEMNDKANEIYERIIAELKPENGEKTRKDLWAMYRGAFGKQAEHSLNLMKQGFDAGNMQMFQVGKTALFSLRSELDSLSSVTMDQLSDVDSENSMEDLFMSTLESPVSAYLKDIYTAKDILNYQLPGLDEGYISGASGVANVDAATSGIKKLEEIIASRARAVRGENANIQQPNVNARQGLYFPTNSGMAPTVGSPFQQQQVPMMNNPNLPHYAQPQLPNGFQQQAPFPGAAQPISAGQIGSPLQRSGGR